MDRIKYYIPGLILILAGVFIIVFPEILIALIASIVIMAGIGALIIGGKISKAEQTLKNMPENGFHERDRSIFKNYRKWF